ncbi:MAG TPA: endonuclease/exonuclease/phosphatase family protein [Mycobacterium sp.]|jgi:endonuclease/exonuclease/phosphatase (EEP) superfamily protein YafD|nr:endonuclease/exonuclease/phosphatase family protein [Mycobacterium sp.]
MIRGLATVIGALALAVAAVGLVARYLPISNEVVLVVAAVSPYLSAAALAAMILFALIRRWVLTIVAALLCAVMLVVLMPRFLGPEKSTVPTVSVRVLTANLGLGQADPKAVVALAHDTADVLVVQEMTPGLAAALVNAGLDGVMPHRSIDPRLGASGIGIWSRYPIADSQAVSGYAMPMRSARIQVPGVAIAPVVLAVHLAAPWVQPLQYFRDDIGRFPTTLQAAARDAASGAVIVAGDLNSTYDMRPFRRLLDEGYRDAAEQAGAGLTRSFPSRPWRGPVVGIDHILVRNCTATQAQTVLVPGSDHRGLSTVIELPVDPTAS